jgi:hypothetical protein
MGPPGWNVKRSPENDPANSSSRYMTRPVTGTLLAPLMLIVHCTDRDPSSPSVTVSGSPLTVVPAGLPSTMRNVPSAEYAASLGSAISMVFRISPGPKVSRPAAGA